jgi:hypothetical protein
MMRKNASRFNNIHLLQSACTQVICDRLAGNVGTHEAALAAPIDQINVGIDLYQAISGKQRWPRLES